MIGRTETPTGGARANAGETAMLIGSLAFQLSDNTAADLMRLVGHELAAQSAGRRRETRLGLLIEMYERAPAEPITPEQYTAERSRRVEAWPSATAIIDAYGGWNQAGLAALRFVNHGSAARVPSDHKHGKVRRARTRADAYDAFHKFRRQHGAWPHEQEFYEWASLTRAAARNAGRPEPRLVGPAQLVKLFGDFERALHRAREEWSG